MNKVHLYDKILSPVVTEKSTSISEQNKIVFKVPRTANKINLKKTIEKIFKVNVTKINIINKKSLQKASIVLLCTNDVEKLSKMRTKLKFTILL